MMLAPAGARRSCVTFNVFSMTFGREAREQGRDHTDLSDAVGRDAQQRSRIVRDRERRIALRSRNGERNDLDGRDHLARNHRLVGRKRRERDGFINLVEAIDPGLVDHQHAGSFAQIDWRAR